MAITRTELLAAAETLTAGIRGWKADHNGWIYDPANPGENLGPIHISTSGRRRATHATIILTGTIGDHFNTADSVAAGELYGRLEIRDFYTGTLIDDDHAGRVEALMDIAKQAEKRARGKAAA